jgi:hypothetical protein
VLSHARSSNAKCGRSGLDTEATSGKLAGKLGILSAALDTLKALWMQDIRDAGGGTRTPDTRIMIPLL